MNSLIAKIIKWLQKVLLLWVRTDLVDKNFRDWEISKQSNVVYVLEKPSLTDLMVTNHLAAGLNFPSALNSGKTSSKHQILYFFVHGRTLKNRGISPRLEQIIETQINNPNENILLVPVTIIWGRSPKKQSNSIFRIFLSDNWGVTSRFRKLITILLNGRRTYAEFSKPLPLNELIANTQDETLIARKTSRILRLHFSRIRTRVIGPDLSHRRVLLQQIIRSPEIRGAIKTHAGEHGISEQKARKTAQRYGREIAASLSYTMVRFLDGLLTRLWNKLYDGVNVHHIQPVRSLAKTHELIYIPCHRSHIDYLLLSYCLFHKGLNIPHIAAGRNLNLPVIGSILRRGGAFFIRRTFKDNPLYSAVFSQYLHQVFNHGHPVEFFIEGGRSRTGKSMSPKTGMLAIALRSYLKNHSRPLAIIPVYIGYEKVFEDTTYLKELRGKEKDSESILGLIKSIRKLRNFGQVALNFGQPIKVDEFLHSIAPEPDLIRVNSDQLHHNVNLLATEIMTGINSAAALNPINLIASVILSTPQRAITESYLTDQLAFMRNMHENLPYSGLVTFPEGSPNDWIHTALQRKWLIKHQIETGLSAVYSLTAEKAILMTYYRNNVLHLFALPSLIACLFTDHSSWTLERAVKTIERAYPYIQTELFLKWPKSELESIVSNWLNYLLSKSILTGNLDGNMRLARDNQDAIERINLLSKLIMPTLERYFLILSVLTRHSQNRLSQEELEQWSAQLVQKLAILNGLNAPEFFDKKLINQFIRTMIKRTIVTEGPENKLTYSRQAQMALNDVKKVLPVQLTIHVDNLLKEILT